MKREQIKAQLIEYMGSIDIVDTHEHLAVESKHIENNYNFFHWFIPYVQYDLYGAGMPLEWLWEAPQTEREVKEYWEVVGLLWKYVKHGTYALPARIALKKFYDISDINDDNYLDIGSRMNETRYKGYYDKIIKDMCKIKYLITQNGRNRIEEHDYMLGAYRVIDYINPQNIHRYIVENPKANISDYSEHIKDGIKNAKNEGAELCKYDTICFLWPASHDKAQEQFDIFKKDKTFEDYSEILIYVSNESLKILRELDLVAAVHTGVWGDINKKSPEVMFPYVQMHPDVTFDIYHMGMPYVREAGFLGKNYHNAYLNLCWSHIVSKEMTINALDEWLDYVPTNKIFGFGADFCTNPENIWAHLEIAKDNIAEVLTRRIEKDRMDTTEAMSICKQWLYDNPAKVYKLDTRKV